MNKQRLTILILAALGMLATFMPWVNAPIIGSVNGTQGNDGWVTMALFAIPVALCLMNDKTKPLMGFRLYGAILPAVITAAIAIWKITDFKSKMAKMGDDNPFAEMLDASVSIGFGLYVLILAGLAIPAAGFLIKDKPTAENQYG